MEHESARSSTKQERSPLGPMSTMHQPSAAHPLLSPASAASSRIPVPKRLAHGQPVSSLPQHRTPSLFGAQEHATPHANGTPIVNGNGTARNGVKHAQMASAAPAARMVGRHNVGAAPATGVRRRSNEENMMAQSTTHAPRHMTEIPKRSKTTRRNSGGLIPSSRRSLGLSGTSRSRNTSLMLRRTVIDLTRALGQNRADWQGQKNTLATLQDLFDKSDDDALATLEPVLPALVEMLASLILEARAQVVPDVCAVISRIATGLSMDDCVGGAALGPAVSSLARVAIKRGSSAQVSNVVLDCLGSIFNASDKIPLAELLCGYDNWCLSGESANVLVTLGLRSWSQRQRIAHVTDLLKLVKERSNDLYANSSEHKQARFGAYAVWKLDFTMSCVCVAALCDTDRATIGMEYPDLRDEIKRVAPVEDGTRWFDVDRVLLLKGKSRDEMLLRQQQAHQPTGQTFEEQQQQQQAVGDQVKSSVSGTDDGSIVQSVQVEAAAETVGSLLTETQHGMTASLVAAASASATAGGEPMASSISTSAVEDSVATPSTTSDTQSDVQVREKSGVTSKSTHKRMEMLGQWKLHRLGLDQSPASTATGSTTAVYSTTEDEYNNSVNCSGSARYYADHDATSSVAGSVPTTPTSVTSGMGGGMGTPAHFPKAPTNTNQCPRSDAVKAVLKDKTRRFGSTMRQALLTAAQVAHEQRQEQQHLHEQQRHEQHLATMSAPISNNPVTKATPRSASRPSPSPGRFASPRTAGRSGTRKSTRSRARRPFDETAADADVDPEFTHTLAVNQGENLGIAMAAPSTPGTKQSVKMSPPSTPAVASAQVDTDDVAKVFYPVRTLARTPVVAPVSRGTGRVPSPYKKTPSKLGGGIGGNVKIDGEMTPMKMQVQALAAAIEQDAGFHSARAMVSTPAVAPTPAIIESNGGGGGMGLSQAGLADLQKRIDAMTKRLNESKGINRNMAAVFDSARASVAMSPDGSIEDIDDFPSICQEVDSLEAELSARFDAVGSNNEEQFNNNNTVEAGTEEGEQNVIKSRVMGPVKSVSEVNKKHKTRKGNWASKILDSFVRMMLVYVTFVAVLSASFHAAHTPAHALLHSSILDDAGTATVNNVLSDVNMEAVLAVVDAKLINAGIYIGNDVDADVSSTQKRESERVLMMKKLTAQVAQMVQEEAGLAAAEAIRQIAAEEARDAIVAEAEAVKKMKSEQQEQQELERVAIEKAVQVEAEANAVAEAAMMVKEQQRLVAQQVELQRLEDEKEQAHLEQIEKEEEAKVQAEKLAQEQARAELEAQEQARKLAQEEEEKVQAEIVAQAQAEKLAQVEAQELEAKRIEQEQLAAAAETDYITKFGDWLSSWYASVSQTFQSNVPTAQVDSSSSKLRDLFSTWYASVRETLQAYEPTAQVDSSSSKLRDLFSTWYASVRETLQPKVSATEVDSSNKLHDLLSSWYANVREMLQAKVPLLLHRIEHALEAETLDPLLAHVARLFQEITLTGAAAATLAALTSGSVSALHALLRAIFG